MQEAPRAKTIGRIAADEGRAWAREKLRLSAFALLARISRYPRKLEVHTDVRRESADGIRRYESIDGISVYHGSYDQLAICPTHGPTMSVGLLYDLLADAIGWKDARSPMPDEIPIWVSGRHEASGRVIIGVDCDGRTVRLQTTDPPETS